MPELKLGYNGPEYYRWYDFCKKMFASYADMLGARDGYFGAAEKAFVMELQRRLNLNGARLVIDGIFGDRTAAIVGYRWTGTTTPPVVQPRRKIWIFTYPGSGANWDQGPSFDLGNRCKDVLKLNHQPVYFQKGGYLGFMGGDATFSYDDVIWDQCKSKEYLLDHNTDAQEALRLARQICIQKEWHEENLTDDQLQWIASQLEYEEHDSGYSQSADGVEEMMEYLYGDPGYIHPGDTSQTPSTGKYRLLRHCVKLLVQFGNPSTKDTGIARKVRSAWVYRKVRNVNYETDFYAKVPLSDDIRPPMYRIIVKANMSLPFFVHVIRLGARIIPQWMGVLGGVFGPFAQIMVAGMAGINLGLPLFGQLFGMAGSHEDQKVDDQIYNLLIPTGVITNFNDLIALIGALPGLNDHGRYPFDPVMMEQAYQHIAGFRR